MALAALLRLEGLAQFPTGISRDEAINATYAHNIAVSGVLPLFEDLEEPEPLYRALLALMAHFTGGSVALDRTVSALIGIVTVAIAYWTVLQCLYDLPYSARHLGALAAALSLTLALGHITLSRSLYRGILQPPFMLLTLGCILRGLRTLRWRDACLAGVFLGTTIYTYTSAYVTPLAFGALLLSLLLFRRTQVRRWLPPLVMMGTVALVIMLPLGWRLATNPRSLISRSVDVTNQQFDLPKAVSGMAAQLFVAGDENPQYNVQEQPVIPFAAQPFFVIGLFALLVRFRRPESLYLVVMAVLVCVPVLLGNEITHGLRMVGWFAVFPVVVGIGAGWVAALFGRSISPPQWAGLAVGVLCVGGLLFGMQARDLYRTYWLNANNIRLWKVFGRELNHSEWFFRTDAQQVVRWISQQDQPVLLPASYANLLYVRAWLIEHFPTVVASPVSPIVPDNARVLIPRALGLEEEMRTVRQFVLLQNDTMMLLPPLTVASHNQLLKPSPLESLAAFGHFDVLGDVYALPSPLAFATTPDQSTIRFGDDVMLQGAVYERELTAGTALFTLWWGAQRQPIGHDYMTYLQLQDQDFNAIVGQDERIWRAAFPTSLWQVGDRVPQEVRLMVPALPSGAYRLVAGVYPSFGPQLPAAYGDGTVAANGATVGWLKVPLPPTTLPDDLKPLDVIFDEQFELVVYHTDITTDQQLALQLVWRSQTDWPTTDATIFVHVLDADGNILTQQDSRPLNGTYPTFIWDRGETVITDYRFDVDTSADLRLRIGMYTFEPLRNLHVSQAGRALADDFVVVPVAGH